MKNWAGENYRKKIVHYGSELGSQAEKCVRMKAPRGKEMATGTELSMLLKQRESVVEVQNLEQQQRERESDRSETERKRRSFPL